MRQLHSFSYQYRFREVLQSEIWWQSLPSPERFARNVMRSERQAQLREDLSTAVRRLTRELSQIQQRVIDLHCQGLTIKEIGKVLATSPQTVFTALRGNRRGQRHEGGAIQRLRRLARHDPEVKTILAEIKELNEAEW